LKLKHHCHTHTPSASIHSVKERERDNDRIKYRKQEIVFVFVFVCHRMKEIERKYTNKYQEKNSIRERETQIIEYGEERKVAFV